MVNGEPVSALAREYGVDKANISRRFSKQARHIRDVVKGLLVAEWSLEALSASPPITEIMGVEITEFFNRWFDQVWAHHRAGMKARRIFPGGFSTFFGPRR